MNIINKLSNIFKKEEKESIKIIKLDNIDSTNSFFKTYTPEDKESFTVAVANYQIAGKGQGNNKWESERGKNLLFSILLHPYEVPIASQFMLSEYGAISLKDALSTYIDKDITLKWPNDIYWKDKKLSGTLIETKLSNGRIKDCIFGVGLNVNQTNFNNDIPNPISLCQILGHEVNIDELLKKIIKAFKTNYELIRSANYGAISAIYHQNLYRAKGFYEFEDANGKFQGSIIEVEDNGTLILRDKEGIIREYKFKELKYGKI